MDLTLALTYQEQNDNKALILTDATTVWDSYTTSLVETDSTVSGDMYEVVTSATLNLTTVGATLANPSAGARFIANAVGVLGSGDVLKPVTPTYAEITAMTLDTEVTDVEETPVDKDQVDLYDEFGPFAVPADLIYTITAELLGDTADSELVDGLYALVYEFTYKGADGAVTKTVTYPKTILVYGVVKVTVYEMFRVLNQIAYMCQDSNFKTQLMETDLAGAYLSGIESSAYIAKTEELLDMLVTLTNIVANGSNITW